MFKTFLVESINSSNKMSDEMLKVSFNAFSFSNIFKIVFTRSSSKIKLAMIFLKTLD